MVNYPAVWRLAATRAERDALIALRTEVYRDAQKQVAASETRDVFDDNAYLIGVWEGRRLLEEATALLPVAQRKTVMISPHDLLANLQI